MMALASLLGEVTTLFLDFLRHFLVQNQNERDESTALYWLLRTAQDKHMNLMTHNTSKVCWAYFPTTLH